MYLIDMLDCLYILPVHWKLPSAPAEKGLSEGDVPVRISVEVLTPQERANPYR